MKAENLSKKPLFYYKYYVKSKYSFTKLIFNFNLS